MTQSNRAGEGPTHRCGRTNSCCSTARRQDATDFGPLAWCGGVDVGDYRKECAIVAKRLEGGRDACRATNYQVGCDARHERCSLILRFRWYERRKEGGNATEPLLDKRLYRLPCTSISETALSVCILEGTVYAFMPHGGYDDADAEDVSLRLDSLVSLEPDDFTGHVNQMVTLRRRSTQFLVQHAYISLSSGL